MAANKYDGKLKLIKHNAARVNLPDDPSFPFRLKVSFRPPEFMSLAFICLCGPTEELVVRGMTKELLESFVKENELDTHPRLIKLEITEEKT